MSNSINIDITNLLQQTNDLNNFYCDMIDNFFMQRIGERIDYNSMLDKLCDLTTHLNILLEENDKFQKLTLNDTVSDQILLILKNYQDNLKKSIVQFTHIVKCLYQKSEGTGRYTIFKYNADQKALKRLEQQRTNIGNILQVNAVPYMANARRTM